jgi:hypothetical protein
MPAFFYIFGYENAGFSSAAFFNLERTRFYLLPRT